MQKPVQLILAMLILSQCRVKGVECQVLLDKSPGQKPGFCGAEANRTSCQEGWCDAEGMCVKYSDFSKNSKKYSSEQLPSECKVKTDIVIVIVVVLVSVFWFMPYGYLLINVFLCSGQGKIRERFKEIGTCCWVMLWAFPMVLLIMDSIRREKEMIKKVHPLDPGREGLNDAIRPPEPVPRESRGRRRDRNTGVGGEDMNSNMNPNPNNPNNPNNGYNGYNPNPNNAYNDYNPNNPNNAYNAFNPNNAYNPGIA
jgi:hypothetical protein